MNARTVVRLVALYAVSLLSITSMALAQSPWPPASNANQVLAKYFAQQVQQISAASDTRQFTDGKLWLENRERLRTELADMLGLYPEPARTDLNATIVGTIKRDGILVQRLHFESMPGLYVTANLYRPEEVEKPLPAILYVCGHSAQRETVDGQEISYGNKTGYQRHGAWFARHGYVCLTIDTIQWGEFLGTHWGTYREGRWDWLSKGYTPAGVEAWNGIRAIDYLQTLPEVDGQRIGLTGRSGGGAYSWFTAALDDRVKAVVPVAGITDLENHIVDGCVNGHCDCMFMVNYYQWDYPTLAAMIAPRPLLLANSDNDTIFPLDGVMRTASQVQHVYEILDAKDKLGLLITPGPHKDTPELQVGAFRWFDRFLKGLDVPVDEAAVERFDRKELKVFPQLPEDQIVKTADDVFVQRLQVADQSSDETDQQVLQNLKQRSLAGWPDQTEPLEPTKLWQHKGDAESVELWEFTSQDPWRLRALVVRPENAATSQQAVRVKLLDSEGWQKIAKQAQEASEPFSADQTTVYLAVRGVGPHAWEGNPTELTHIERRFYLLGQTLAGMQIWDALRGIEFARLTAGNPESVLLGFDQSMEGIARYTSALAPDGKIETEAMLPVDYLNSVPLLGQGQVRGLKAAILQASDN